MAVLAAKPCKRRSETELINDIYGTWQGFILLEPCDKKVKWDVYVLYTSNFGHYTMLFLRPGYIEGFMIHLIVNEGNETGFCLDAVNLRAFSYENPDLKALPLGTTEEFTARHIITMAHDRLVRMDAYHAVFNNSYLYCEELATALKVSDKLPHWKDALFDTLFGGITPAIGVIFGSATPTTRDLVMTVKDLYEKYLVMALKGESAVGETLNTNGLNNGETSEALQKKSQLSENEQRFREQLEHKEREKAEKEEEIQHNRHQLQENARELQEKERELQEKEGELKNWVINEDEVILTEEELGRGSYGIVKVGIFRGSRVAVKSHRTIFISDYNLALISREMSIASRVRHPNLVQFIGATKVRNPLILTELMSTSLYKEIQKNRLTKQQILSIAQNVALGLNYLHLFKPQPIMHRDVSSPNVLLDPSASEAGYKAKLADYGTAKILQADGSGTVMPGNPSYAAPEARDPDQHSPAMDVYSYSVLLMEMTLHSQPEMTTIKREQQSHTISWSPMKSLIQRGLNATRQHRPTMSQVIESLKEIRF